MGKRQQYTKPETIHKSILKRRIIKIEKNTQNKKSNRKKNIEITKVSCYSCTYKREEANGSSARHSTVQYMVLAMFDG
jgi:hypothetical protein